MGVVRRCERVGEEGVFESFDAKRERERAQAETLYVGPDQKLHTNDCAPFEKAKAQESGIVTAHQLR